MGFSAGLAVATFVGGAGLSAWAGSKNKPNIPATPQASQVPDANTDISKEAGTGQGGGSPGVASTFLTGPGGIDPSLLNLGKSTLLGGGSTGG